MSEGESFDHAFEPFIADMDSFFEKWRRVDRERRSL
jgi:hypothetical protein